MSSSSKDIDATVMAVTFAKTIARIAEFAVDLAESLHKDLGIEYIPPNSKTGKAVSRKRSRADKDPNEPKRPQTAYMIYSAHAREEFKKRGEPQPQLKDLADMWAKLEEKEKEAFNNEARQQKELYEKQMSEYKAGKAGNNGLVPSQKSESDLSVSDVDDVAPPKLH